MKAKFYIFGFFSAIIVLSIVAGSYFLGKSTNSTNNTSNISPTPTTNTNLKTPNTLGRNQVVATPTPNEIQLTTRQAIEQAITSRNYELLIDYMSVVIPVRVEGSECCGTRTARGAIESLDFIESATPPWEFYEETGIAADLASLYPDHYSNAVVAISENKFMVAFQLNEEGNIKKISMTNDYEVILPTVE
jgi:hypothetical protein